MEYRLRLIDEKGREAIKMKNGRVIVSRFFDMDDKTRKAVIQFYKDFSGDDSQDVVDFVNFKEKEMEFCS